MRRRRLIATLLGAPLALCGALSAAAAGRALAGAGWQVRPFQETAFDCLRFFRSRRETLDWGHYLPAAKARAVLTAWARRASAGG
jgi:hypothetical protein